MFARIRDGANFISKLTLPKFLNGAKLWLTYQLGRRNGNVYHSSWPVSLSIEPTTACNLGCPECPSGLKRFTRNTGNLSIAEFRNWILPLSRHLCYINFYFQGEPFIHPGFLEMVRYASSMKIYTSTSTNAHFLDQRKAAETVASGLDRLIISIDGITQEVYSSYRIHGKLSKVIEGTRNIVAEKRKQKSKTPHVIFQFLVVRPNEHQLNEIHSLAHELGVDEVRFKTAQIYDYENGNPLIPLQEKYSRYRRTVHGKFEVKNKLDDHCWRMWSSSVITWDGKVVPCCFDKDATHQLGDLRQNSFAEIWNGVPYRKFREQLFVSRKEIDICANCSEGTRVWA